MIFFCGISQWKKACWSQNFETSNWHGCQAKFRHQFETLSLNKQSDGRRERERERDYLN